tara:strand:- start:1864 stop:2052 length:189 start_codon:yes stop_codon:yes gene_type:complete
MNVQTQSGAIQEETKRKIAEEEQKREAERVAAGGPEATLVEVRHKISLILFSCVIQNLLMAQ